MGTRSITRVFEGSDRAAVIIYRQHDGYPEGHGLDLAGFLKGRRLVDGLAPGADGAEVSNGMGCLAASLICALKTGPGGIYLTPDSDEQEEYEYDIRAKGADIFLRVRKWGEQIFDGNLERFAAFCASPGRE